MHVSSHLKQYDVIEASHGDVLATLMTAYDVIDISIEGVSKEEHMRGRDSKLLTFRKYRSHHTNVGCLSFPVPGLPGMLN